MKVRTLTWLSSKVFEDDGDTFKIEMAAQLHDTCKNTCCSFSIGGKVYKIKPNGQMIFIKCGCIHDDIALHFPELRKFLPLHMCNYLGQPLYPIENGQYLVKKDRTRAMRYLRITEDEYYQLLPISDKEERPYFKYRLFDLGIVDRWKREADEFIGFLQQKTGDTWTNPYNPSEWRFVLQLTDDERTDIERKLEDGYYTQEVIERRKEERYNAKREAVRLEIIERYDEEMQKIKDKRDVKLYIHDSGMPINNVIFYPQNKQVVFNWLDSRDKITKEQFDNFVSRVDYSKLPKGVTFQFAK